jgi:hypothetical protein
VTVYPIPQNEPAEFEAESPEEKERKPINSWLLAGCGCLVVILLIVIALAIFIDQPFSAGAGRYCDPPFNLIFGALGYCP